MAIERRVWVLMAAAALLGAVAGAAVTWAALDQTAAEEAAPPAELEALAARADSADALAERRASEIESLTARIEELSARLGDGATSRPTEPADDEPVRQFAFITALRGAHPAVLEADYARFLTGDEAADAAAQAGDESPPPNDFYIVNPSTATRRLAVDADAEVTLVSKPGEGTGDAYESDVETLAQYFADDSEDTVSIRTNGYWLTIEDGRVAAIEEQYLP